jgi:hypothetical protein
LSKSLVTLATPQLGPVRSIPVITKEENEDIIIAKEGDVYIDFRGIVLLGIPYGFLYYKQNIPSGPTRVRKISTKLGQSSSIFSADLRIGIISQEEFEKLEDSDLFNEVVFIEI